MVGCGYVQSIEVDASDVLKSAFRILTLEFELTETGVLAYREVIALVFEYLRIVRDEWLANDETLSLFEEYRTISQLSYDIYTVPDAEENVCYLAGLMVDIHDPRKLLKKAAAMPVVDDYDIKDIRQWLEEFSYENCKMILMGKGILSNSELLEKASKPISGVKKEQWTQTKYQLFEKDKDYRDVYADKTDQWQ